MKQYSEKDIKNYFRWLMQNYPKSNVRNQAAMMMLRMFNGEYDTLEYVTAKLNREKS